MAKIIVTCDNTGGVSIDGQGFRGKACLKATKFLEKALGTLKRRTNKREMWQQQATRTVNRG